MSDKFELSDIMAYNILKDRKSCFNAGFDVGKKQGALKELKKAYKDIDVLWSKISLDLMTASKIKDILYNRIKELECEKE